MAGTGRDKVIDALKWLRSRGGSAMVALVVLMAFLLGFAFRGAGDESSYQAQKKPMKPGDVAMEYTCSMHPEVRMPNPDDKCPICNMNLIPVSSPGGSGTSGLKTNEIELSPRSSSTDRRADHPRDPPADRASREDGRYGSF